MADPYIDEFETLIYGKFARDQMAAVCLGKIKELDKMVEFAISIQETADSDMRAILNRHPRPQPTADPASVLEKADLAPEVAAARSAWLNTYNANKLLIRGLLAHIGKPELLSLIFDDLAEVHRASGVSGEDEAAPSEDMPTPRR
jgi:hypothetical protein